MRKGSTFLYALIHSLSKSEKRYFSLEAQKGNPGKQLGYYAIYDIIQKEGIQSDADLLEQIRGTGVEGYLPVAKRQVSAALLKALSQYHGKSSVDEEIKRGCQQAQILFDKGFPKKSGKFLDLAKKRALQYERFHLLFEILEIRKKIISTQYYNTVSFEALEELHNASAEYRRLIENKNQYWLLFSQIYKLHFKSAKSKDVREKTTLQNLFSSPLLLNNDQALSNSAKLDFLQLHALKHFIDRNPEGAFSYNAQLLELFAAHPHLLETQPERYRSTLNNYLIDCVQLRKSDELREGLIRLRELPTLSSFE